MATLNNAALDQFNLEWNLVVQQENSVFKDWVTVDQHQGERKRYNLLQDEEYKERTGRLQATTFSEPDVNLRWLYTTPFDLVNRWDRDDEFLLAELGTPNSALMQKFAASYARRCDDTLIAAFDATVKTGKLGTTDLAFPAAQSIAVDANDFGTAAGNTNLTVAKIRRARRVLEAADVDLEREMPCFVTSPIGKQALLNDPEVTSGDYNTVRALVNGEIDTYMGFKWKTSTRLPISSNTRSCFAWCPSGIKFNPGAADAFRLDELPENRYDRQLYSYVRLGAMRYYDEKIVRVYIDETAAV